MNLNIQDYELKIIYSEILKGSSKLKLGSLFLFVKHISNSEHHLFEEKKMELIKYAKQNSIPHEEDKMDFLIRKNLWSEDKESEIRNEKYYLDNLYKTRSKLFRSRDINNIDKQINESKSKLAIIEHYRNEALGLTLERYVDQQLQNYAIISSIYTDENLIQKYLNEDDYLDREDIDIIIKKYYETFSRFNAKNIKQICVSSFFLDQFLICDNNPNIFFGKPVVNLTDLQIAIFRYGCFFKNIFSEGGDSIPDEWRHDPEKLEEWYNAGEHRKKIMERAGNSDGVGIVTKDPEDMKKLGLQNNGSRKMREAINKKGGSVGIMDQIKMTK